MDSVHYITDTFHIFIPCRDYEDAELNSQSYLQIRRRLVQVSQRLDSLEIENRGRDKRDYLLYTSLFLYLLFRGIRFISSQNQF